mmetsp:Transcript_5737/g.13469  ORF Transcript_5737/g.13469 Transcript_5737/m.13469 type:complete len:236 (+) Transcript_5737:1936-2643(+)
MTRAPCSSLTASLPWTSCSPLTQVTASAQADLIITPVESRDSRMACTARMLSPSSLMHTSSSLSSNFLILVVPGGIKYIRPSSCASSQRLTKWQIVSSFPKPAPFVSSAIMSCMLTPMSSKDFFRTCSDSSAFFSLSSQDCISLRMMAAIASCFSMRSSLELPISSLRRVASVRASSRSAAMACTCSIFSCSASSDAALASSAAFSASAKAVALSSSRRETWAWSWSAEACRMDS